MREDALQVAVMDFLRIALFDTTVAIHVPNGGSRNVVEAAKLKRMGTVAGVPDIIVFHDCRAYGIELKTERGHLSKPQRAFHARLTLAGVPVRVCRSIAEVEGALDGWDIPRRARAA